MKQAIVGGVAKLQWFNDNDCLNYFASPFETSLTAEKYNLVPCQNNCDFFMKGYQEIFHNQRWFYLLPAGLMHFKNGIFELIY